MEILHTVFYTALLVRRATYVRRLHGDDIGIELGCCFVAITRDRMGHLQGVIMRGPKFWNHSELSQITFSWVVRSAFG